MVAPAVDGIDLLTRATDLLNMFTAEKNVLGMWDSVDGGYFLASGLVVHHLRTLAELLSTGNGKKPVAR